MTSDASAKLTAERTAMVKDCISKFDAAAVAPKDLGGLADLYAEANQLDLANAAVARALAAKTLPEADRATLLGQSIRLMLREPKSDERNARHREGRRPTRRAVGRGARAEDDRRTSR